MLSVIVVVLIFGVMLLVCLRLGLGLLQEYRQQRRVQKLQAPVQTIECRAMTILNSQQGVVMNAALPLMHQPLLHLPPAWYRRMRMFISLSFLLMILLTLFVQSGLADGTLKNLGKDLSLLGYSQFSSSDVRTAAHAIQVNASQQLFRISQLDPSQYNSSAEYNIWAYSACSAASMTEVFDAYGRHFRITDVLKVESQIGAITPQLGLVDPSGIQATATQFGFKTVWSNSWTLDQILNFANQGKPVIISFPPDRYAGGHILVLLGGDANMVYLADTSLWNHRALTHGQFLNWWEGFGAVVTPA
ncbi:MAG: C39 family peptidase [Ktedonobacteraceae bacterium]